MSSQGERVYVVAYGNCVCAVYVADALVFWQVFVCIFCVAFYRKMQRNEELGKLSPIDNTTIGANVLTNADQYYMTET